MQSRPRRIGLALGGGGGKGSAHIGVLTALEALRVPVDVVAGTSIGGIVAAMYAVGYQPYEIEQWFLRATAWRILERDTTNSGFLGTRKIESMLREIFATKTFADARVPLALVAVDINAGREVILNDGPLVEAVLATTAVPGIFPPLVKGEQLLVDGGVLNNLPVDVAYTLGAERVIAVDLGMIAEYTTFGTTTQSTSGWSPQRWMPRSQLMTAERALAIMMARITEQRLQQTPPNVLLRPVVSSLLPFDFTRTVEGRMHGERATFEQRDVIEELRDWRIAEQNDPFSSSSIST
jgi:NTE family protein